MALETATYIDALVVSNPDGADQRATADDHLRLIKAALKRSFPMVGGAVSASAAALSRVNDLSLSAQSQLNTLRDGPATANYAVVATTAISASSAAALDGVAAANWARADQSNTLLGSQNIYNNQRHVRIYDTDGGDVADYGCLELNDNYLYLWVWDNSAGDYGGILRISIEGGNLNYQGTSITFNGNDLTNPTQLNGAAASAYARLDVARTFNGGSGSTPIVTTGSTGTVTINCEDGDVHRITLTGSITLGTPNAPRPGQTLVIILQQDAAGSHLVTWSTAFRFAGGSTPTLSTGSLAKDVFAFIYDNTDSQWLQSGLNVTR